MCFCRYYQLGSSNVYELYEYKGIHNCMNFFSFFHSDYSYVLLCGSTYTFVTHICKFTWRIIYMHIESTHTTTHMNQSIVIQKYLRMDCRKYLVLECMILHVFVCIPICIHVYTYVYIYVCVRIISYKNMHIYT
jgi:hypothetical protein